MILPDINLLIYAYNQADIHHQDARNWWESLLNGTEPVAIPWMVSTGFIRLMTHPRVLEMPMAADHAVACVRSWMERPCVIIIEPGLKFADIFFACIDSAGTAGNLTTDAYIAALAIEHQAEIHSNDSDFDRFSGLRWSNPLK